MVLSTRIKRFRSRSLDDRSAKHRIGGLLVANEAKSKHLAFATEWLVGLGHGAPDFTPIWQRRALVLQFLQIYSVTKRFVSYLSWERASECFRGGSKEFLYCRHQFWLGLTPVSLDAKLVDLRQTPRQRWLHRAAYAWRTWSRSCIRR